jgi:hypothetical protein
MTGEYVFSTPVRVRITAQGGRLFAQATGERKAYAIPLESRVELLPVTPATFTVPGRYPLVLDFGKPGLLVVNPGHWQQSGTRLAD